MVRFCWVGLFRLHCYCPILPGVRTKRRVFFPRVKSLSLTVWLQVVSYSRVMNRQAIAHAQRILLNGERLSFALASQT
jgi:hypothetical protein